MSLDPGVEEHIHDAPLSAHLATSDDDRPYVAPVRDGYREGTLHTIMGG